MVKGISIDKKVDNYFEKIATMSQVREVSGVCMKSIPVEEKKSWGYRVFEKIYNLFNKDYLVKD